ncbi:hypothetical protein PFISCL1PPCAC_6756, partial [Pristionchus fissidentatus]
MREDGRFIAAKSLHTEQKTGLSNSPFNSGRSIKFSCFLCYFVHDSKLLCISSRSPHRTSHGPLTSVAHSRTERGFSWGATVGGGWVNGLTRTGSGTAGGILLTTTEFFKGSTVSTLGAFRVTEGDCSAILSSWTQKLKASSRYAFTRLDDI